MTASSDRGIVAKIRKLLALAQSSNEHEAALAASMAQELMLKYAVDEAAVAEEGSAAQVVDSGDLRVYSGKIPHWHKILAHALAPAFMCKSISVLGQKIFIIGRAANRESCIATFDWLQRSIARMADVRLIELQDANDPDAVFSHGRRWKRGFCMGAVDVIADKLAHSRAQLVADTTGVAIVLRKAQAEIQLWMSKAGMNTTKIGSVNNTPSTGYAEGQAYGRTLNLDSKVGQRKLGSGGK